MKKLPRPLQITEIITENAVTKTFILSGSMKAEPGQFVMAWLPALNEKPFSLAGIDPIRLTIAAVGNFSRAIHNLRKGDYLWLRGPLGRGFTLPESRTEILLVGGGYGVAPLLFLAKKALAKEYRVSIIIGARDKANLLLGSSFNELGISPIMSTEDGSSGLKGVVTDAMKNIINHHPQMVYACGPTGMLSAIAELCQIEKIPFQLAWEAYMRCGMGLCGSCELGQGWLSCLDGPVFSFNPALI